jgi:hypothetical protein
VKEPNRIVFERLFRLLTSGDDDLAGSITDCSNGDRADSKPVGELALIAESTAEAERAVDPFACLRLPGGAEPHAGIRTTSSSSSPFGALGRLRPGIPALSVTLMPYHDSPQARGSRRVRFELPKPKIQCYIQTISSYEPLPNRSSKQDNTWSEYHL